MPVGIRVLLSRDAGKTWDPAHDLYETENAPEQGYLATVELEDGSLLPVFYAHSEKDSPAVILQQKWRMKE